MMTPDGIKHTFKKQKYTAHIDGRGGTNVELR